MAPKLYVSSLEQITQSPYEGNKSAEVGERLFEYTQSLMDPQRGLSSASRRIESPSDEAIEVFGEEQAVKILKTNHFISCSRMLYGCDWTEGIIQGSRCGRLEKDVLLLCLRDHRIAYSTAYGLKNIIKDLGLWDMVSSAFFRWKLQAKFPLLERCDIRSFKNKQTQCFKSILFIARAAMCMKYLEWNFLAISEDVLLKTKIYACFEILEKSIKVNRMNEMPTKVPIQKKKSKKRARITSTGPTKQTQGNNSTKRARKISTGPTKQTQGNDLTRRLRSKHFKIVGVQFHSEQGEIRHKERFTSDTPKEASASHIPETLRSLSKKVPNRKRSFGKTSSCSLPETNKKQKSTFSHALFNLKSNINKKDTGTSVNSLSENNSRGNPSPLHAHISAILPEKKVTGFSHVLFCTKYNNSHETEEQKFVNVPKEFAFARNRDIPSYVSDGSSMYSSANDPNFWYPVDPNELILNSLQIEVAWLVEESMYCNRNTNIDWIFVMKYASPVLQIELRQINDVDGNNVEENLARLFQNRIEIKRFVVVRREVRRKLLKNLVRTRMQGIIPKLRKATHPLRLEKMRLRKKAIEDAANKAVAVAENFDIDGDGESIPL